MAKNVTEKLIESHLVSGAVETGKEIGLKVDQTLTQDATGTLVMLELEAMQLDHVHTELSAQYVDHNLIQEDYKNADDHLFLRSACRKFGLWYSRPRAYGEIRSSGENATGIRQPYDGGGISGNACHRGGRP